MLMTLQVDARLRDPAQFKLGMDQKVVAKSAHFALHAPAAAQASDSETPTTMANHGPTHLIGAVIPKRWAKRAVTRNAIRRQIYQAWAHWLKSLPAGMHVVRLKTGFDAKQFHSASSKAFKTAVRTELNQLFQHRAGA
jgi:ribonuclease P protein component